TKALITEAGFSPSEILQPIVLTSIDVAPKEQQLGVMLGSFLPFLLITGIVSGAIYPAIDAMAGEKERGTLETLLTLPVSNTEIVTGKFFAISVVGIITAILHIISIIMSIGILVSSMLSSSGGDFSLFTSDLNFWTMIPAFLITILSVLIFTITITALSISVCSFAKSYKDAQNYLTPLTLIFMLPSMIAIIPTIELSSFTALIPVVNIALLIKGVLIGRIGLELVFLALFVNLAFAAITIIFMSKIFNSEAVLFSSNFTFDFLEKRSDIKPKKSPPFSEGIIFYFIILVIFLIVSSILQPIIGLTTLIVTQLLFLGASFLFTWYVKADFKHTFSLKIPKLHHILGSLILYAGGFVFVQLLSNLMFTYIPFVRYMNEQLSGQIIIESLFLNLLIVAILPAICEEVLFRGVIYSSISSKCSPKVAIVISSILFGIMHLDPARIILTSILGIVFAYTLYYSKSIFIPILLHLINNGMAVLIEHFSAPNDLDIIQPLTTANIAVFLIV
ncbi:MAG: ABC transporter permease subunit/CPBP intramembrane protease, partial [Oscillospiraceae bacterium]